MSTDPSPDVVAAAGPVQVAVDGLARRITAVYQDADDGLRQAVLDSWQAGMPASALPRGLDPGESGDPPEPAPGEPAARLG